jgi:hypothetical protein
MALGIPSTKRRRYFVGLSLLLYAGMEQRTAQS